MHQSSKLIFSVSFFHPSCNVIPSQIVLFYQLKERRLILYLPVVWYFNRGVATGISCNYRKKKKNKVKHFFEKQKFMGKLFIEFVVRQSCYAR
jgi:hypothetical protein